MMLKLPAETWKLPTSNAPMLLNTSIFRNIQLTFVKIFLLFIPVSIVEEAEFCMKEVLISPNILNHPPQLLSPIYIIESTANLVGFPSVSLCSAEMFTCLQKRNESTKWSKETTGFMLLPKDHSGVRNISGYPSLALLSHLKHLLVPDQQRKFQ